MNKTLPSPTTICFQHYQSPCGSLVLASTDHRLCLCDWLGTPQSTINHRRIIKGLNATFVESTSDVILQAQAQLDAYFAGLRTQFDIALLLVGTPFQQRVWTALQGIAYGTTTTYAQVARQVGCPAGVRAVAQAIGANGLSIFVPCHRVIGAQGALTGYAGGLAAKRILLEAERSIV